MEPAQSTQRIDGIDGLRAVSILIVLLGHGSSTRGSPAIFTPLRNMGIVGVELFFAISGFVITLLLLREWQRDGRLDLQNFWIRRALRILPPFAMASAGIALAASCGIMEWHWSSLWGAVTFTKNLPLFSGDWFFGHFWSLAVEEQFYLCWPLIFILLMPVHKVTPALLAIVLASPLLALLCMQALPALQNLLPYLPYLAIGALLATLFQLKDSAPFSRSFYQLRWRSTFLWSLCIVAIGPAYLCNNHIKMNLTVPLNALLMPAAIFFILLETTRRDGLLNRTLNWPPMRGLGRISYSVYLWQQLFMGPPDTYSTSWIWSQWPLNILAAIACGALGYYAIEWPCSRLRSRLQSRPQNIGGTPSYIHSANYKTPIN